MRVLIRQRQPGALHDVGAGLAAGAAGTAAMDAAQALVSRIRPPEEPEREPPSDEERWEQAPAPAQVVRKATTSVAGRDIDPERIPALATVVHWLYGSSWGAGFALAHRRLRGPAAVEGVAFGTAVWAVAYAELVPLQIYEPPWRYPLRSLAKDLAMHLVYGAATATAFVAARRALRR